MKLQLKTLLGILIMACLTTVAAFEMGPKMRLRSISGFAETVLSEWKVPGMAIAVVKDGETILMDAYGHRDVENKIPVTNETMFAIGSATKAFTALGIMLLADEGKLDLDTPLKHYLPDLKLYDEYTTDHVTARDILSHRTGIPSHDAIWILTDRDRDELYKRMAYLHPNQEFRYDFQYNNTMYALAGVVIERLSGETWEEFIQVRIFDELKMHSSIPSLSNLLSQSDFSYPYLTFGEKPQRIQIRDNEATRPAGAIASNIEDMGKWLMLNMNTGQNGNSQFIAESSLLELFKPTTAISSPLYQALSESRNYGLGWYVTDYRGYEMVEHGGNIDGFSTMVSFLPEENIGVVVLTNSMNIASYVVIREIYDRLLGLEKRDWNQHYQQRFAQLMSMMGGKASDEPEDKSTNHSLPLDQYVGTFSHPAFDTVDVQVSDGLLALRFQSGIQAQLEHINEDQFLGRSNDLYLPQFTVNFVLSEFKSIEKFTIPLETGVPEIAFIRQMD